MDYNNDGFPDLIVGERDGGVWLFTGDSEGLLPGETIPMFSVGKNSSPLLVDWDENGFLDLLVGGYPLNGDSLSGVMRLHMNTATSINELKFSFDYTELLFWNKYRTTQEMFDLDRDGDKDLILGNENGKIYFAPNVGTNSEPVFFDYFPLSAGGIEIDVGGKARENIDDWNEDGIPDLIIANTTTDKVQVFLGYDMGIEDGSGGLEPEFSVSGSPTTGLFSAEIVLAEPQQLVLSVYDCQGREAMSYRVSSPQGHSSTQCNIGALQPGVYFICADFSESVLTDRVVLIR